MNIEFKDQNFLKSNKFNTIEILLSLINDKDFDKDYYLSLLLSILNVGCEKYPTKSSMVKKTYDLYNAAVFLTRKNYFKAQLLSLSIQTINPKYVNDNNLLHECIDLAYNLLYKPLLNENKDGFDEKIFAEKKKRLIASIKSNYNAKNYYARIKLLENTKKEDEPKLVESLDVSLVEKISNKELYKFYLDYINNSKIIVTASGDIEKEEIEKELSNFNFKSKERTIPALFETKDYKIEKVNKVIEYQNISQAKLFMSFRSTINHNDDLNVPAFIFNTMFGGMFTSSLCENIREKQSLVYHISSSFDTYRKIMTITSGNEQSKSDYIIDEVLKELSNYQKGIIKDADILLERAKETLLNSIKETNDEAFGRIETIERSYLMDFRSEEEIIKRINDSTLEDIINASKTFTLDTIFILRGKENE